MIVETSHLFFELEEEVLESNNMKTEQQGDDDFYREYAGIEIVS